LAIKQWFPKLPIILLSAYSEMPERILRLMDEKITKSDLTDGLVPLMEGAHKRRCSNVVLREASSETAPWIHGRHSPNLLKELVAAVGLEPTTYGL
jgi:hypothetical protein